MLELRVLLVHAVAFFWLVGPSHAIVLRHRHETSVHHAKRNVESGNVNYELVLSNFNNVQYSGVLSLGGQHLPVVYDTGSCEILVLSTLCSSCAASLTKYDRSRSTTFVPAGDLEAQHVFGSGAVNSRKGFERVWIGDANSPYSVVKMPFWEVTDHNIALWNEHAHFSGIVGLCNPSPMSLQNQQLETTLLQAAGVSAFAFCFQRYAQNATGLLHIGPAIAALAQNTHFVTMPVVGNVHWGLQMTSISAPGVNVANPCNPSCGAIIDSGTSLIAAPLSAGPLIEALKGMVKADCSNIDQLPTLQLTVGGQYLELPPHAYVIRAHLRSSKMPLDRMGIWDFIWNGPTTTTVDECTVAFMPIQKNSQFGAVWILGMPFLRYYYTVFDRSTRSIHVAKSSPHCQVPYAGIHAFANISPNKKNIRAKSLDTKTDAFPTWVDLNAARLARWAFRNTSKEIVM